MESRNFETIESESIRVLRSGDQSAIKNLFEEIKNIPEAAVNQMPEVVYARYLRLLAKAGKYMEENR